GVVIHRFDSEPVSDQQKPLLPAIPDRKREHAAKVLHAFEAVFFISMDDRLGVGARCELMAAGNQVAGEVRKIIDLTIEDNHYRAVLVEHRLFSTAEVDDAQPAMPE